MSAICNIKLKVRNPKNADAMSHLGSNAGELNDALVTTMKRGRIIWDIADGTAVASFNMNDIGYTKSVLKDAVNEFKDDEEIDCEMNFTNAMPETTSQACNARVSFFTRIANGVRSWF